MRQVTNNRDTGGLSNPRRYEELSWILNGAIRAWSFHVRPYSWSFKETLGMEDSKYNFHLWGITEMLVCD